MTFGIVGQLAREPARQILDARPEAAFGAEDVDLLRREVELVGQEARLVPGRTPRAQAGGKRIEGRRRHAERAKELRADVRRIRRARDTRHDLSEELVGEVRVLPLRVHRDAGRDLRCPRERPSGIVLVHGVRPVRPGRLALQPRLVREHAANRQALDRAEWALRGLELGKKRDGWIVERELPLVAKLHDRRRREGLRDRGDPVERLRVGRTPRGPVGEPHASGPRELTVMDDADCGAGQPVLLHEGSGCRLVLGSKLGSGARHRTEPIRAALLESRHDERCSHARLHRVDARRARRRAGRDRRGRAGTESRARSRGSARDGLRRCQSAHGALRAERGRAALRAARDDAHGGSGECDAARGRLPRRARAGSRPTRSTAGRSRSSPTTRPS